jgi:uncharacterized integral membrane protein
VRWARTFWDSRYWIGASFVLGVTLWFIAANRQPVTVTFPFGLGQIQTLAGLAILLGVLFGSMITLLILGMLWTSSRKKTPARSAPAPASTQRAPESSSKPAEAASDDWLDELPPSDYAARTGEGFSDKRW